MFCMYVLVYTDTHLEQIKIFCDTYYTIKIYSKSNYIIMKWEKNAVWFYYI